jgi:hypothetical protein
MENYRDRPLAKLALTYLLSESMGVRIDGKVGDELQSYLVTS